MTPGRGNKHAASQRNDRAELFALNLNLGLMRQREQNRDSDSVDLIGKKFRIRHTLTE